MGGRRDETLCDDGHTETRGCTAHMVAFTLHISELLRILAVNHKHLQVLFAGHPWGPWQHCADERGEQGAWELMCPQHPEAWYVRT